MSAEQVPGGLPAAARGLRLRSAPQFVDDLGGFRLAVYLSDDRMRAYLYAERRLPDVSPSVPEVMARIRAAGIAFGLDEAAVDLCLSGAGRGEKAGFAEIARGRSPEDGADGTVEFYVQPSSEEARYTRDASGRVNYHELNLIENAAAGQQVARLLPPGPGAPGADVLGAAIPFRLGQPARVRPGRGIRTAGEGDLFEAEFPGRVVFQDGTLEISQDFEVRGNVDYSVGNIDFVGRVLVSGEVLDEFDVRGEMRLEVRGTAGSCRLSSGGDVILAGGMAGKSRGRIRAGGTVRAKYLNEAVVEADGNVTVERESYNSAVRTTGAYLSPSGKVRGGEVTALRGIEVGTVGSELGVPTRLCAGVDYRRAERQRRLAEELAAAEAEIDRISAALGPLLTEPDRIHKLPAEKKKAVADLVAHLRSLKEKQGGLLAQREAGARSAALDPVRQINVKERVFAGTVAEIGDCRLLIKQDATGPLTMVEDPDTGSLRLLPFQALGKRSGAARRGDAPQEPAPPGA